MDQKKTIPGVIIAIVGLALVYYFFLADKSGEEMTTQQPAEEAVEAEDAMPETIPAPADVAHIPEDATMTPSGVAIRFITEGDGENYPLLADDITIHYTGWTTDGEMFDSSRLRGEPSTFPLGGLIQGWQAAVPYLSKGSRALVWIPGKLAYDNRPDRPDAPKGMLVFDIELIDFGLPEQE